MAMLKSRKFCINLVLIIGIAVLVSACDPPHIEPAMHSVTFDANGGHWADGTSEFSAEVPDGAPIWDYRPDVPARGGYSFAGWFADKAASDPYDPDSLVTSDATLYAGWSKNTVYRITFDTEGGSSLAPQLVPEGRTARQPQNPEKAGYAFIGWSLDGTSLFSFSTTIRSNMTLHAIWKEAKRIVFSYDLPASLDKTALLSEVPDAMDIPYGETVGSLPSVSLSYGGTEFRFLGWFEKGSDEPFDPSATIDRNIALHGRWEEYAISSSGGYIVYGESGLETWSASSPSLSCTLIADITLAGEWTPIGSSSVPYSAVFDGNGHIISGLMIASDSDHNGLFGYIGESGTVRNLMLSGISIKGSDSAGGIAGENLGRIENCHISGTLEESGIAEGGIAGRNRGTITGCSSSAISHGNGDAGGIAGINYGIIENCTGSGTISGEYVIGGIAGLNADGAVITECSFSGQVTDGYYAGGIAGCNDNGSSISKCSFTGSISDMDWYIGGIAGLSSQESVIRECSSSGVIIGKEEAGGIVGYNFAAYVYASSFSGSVGSNTICGGIAGISLGPMIGCYSSGTVRCNSTAGGIAGINRLQEMAACYSTGIVSGGDTVGTIAGLNEKGTITACFFSGNEGMESLGRNIATASVDTERIDGDTTWEDAMADMNKALSGNGYSYILNTGEDKETFPLIII